jgi:glutamate/tyrosine decarboxylase-like PLP-dependent enzyme
MTPEEFRTAGHQLIDWLADYHSTVAARPVMARTAPGEVRRQLPAAPPDAPEPFAAVLADMERIVMPGTSHWQHPSFFGYFPSNAELSSVLGDFASTGIGALGLSWQSNPALTEIEETVTDWLRQMMGLSAGWSGVIQDTASTCTLLALLCAREKASGYSMVRGGLQAEPEPLTVYVSAMSHSSVDKAALLAGFGRENVRVVAHDAGTYAMNADALDEAIGADLAAGRKPCAVVATTGTTATTAIDPIAAIAAVAKRRGLWLHVDAAMAGSAMILPECRHLWEGVEEADSLVLNPHKWMGVAFDASVYYVRDPAHLIRVMSTNPSFLRSAADSQVKNLRDWGIPLGRRFRALKFWFMLRYEGVEAIQARLRRDIANAKWLEAEVRKATNWRVLAPVPLQTVCVRHTPPGLSGEDLDRHTLGWTERINRSGAAYLTPAILDGRWMTRISIGALTTELEHVQKLWLRIQEEAQVKT